MRSEPLLQRLSDSPAETAALAAHLARALRPPDLLCLEGDLGAGKTVFVHGLAAGLGVVERPLSPTFTLQRIYRGAVPLYHFDLFRLPAGADLRELGVGAEQEDGITVIEWSDRAAFLERWERIVIRFEINSPRRRRISLLRGPARVQERFQDVAGDR